MAELSAEVDMVVSSEPRPVAGIRLAVAASGLRYRGRNDLTLIEIAPGSSFFCVYTKNVFCAAPVTLARRHQAAGTPRFLVINAGNANAGTGIAGEAAALEVCRAMAVAAGCAVTEVLPYSTGVIGQQLRAEILAACAPALVATLDADAWATAAAAIMTTDTCAKIRSSRFIGDGTTYTVTGICKGSGMIRPDMATMLAYVATDAPVNASLMKQLTTDVADASFNCITVDGDTSTNDAFALVATGAGGGPMIDNTDDPRYLLLRAAITEVALELAKDIIRDGEGATKFVTVAVAGAATHADCRTIAYTVAQSPLVKTALFASDPNWGRILAAVGRAEVTTLAIDAVDINIGPVAIVRGGEPVAGYDERQVAAVMKERDVDISIRVGNAATEASVWTCDFSYDYVKINAEYRS